MVNHIRGWGRGGFYSLVNVIQQQKWLERVHLLVLFETKVLYLKIENTPIKDANGKSKLKRMLRFVFVDKRELFALKLSFEEFNFVLFTADPERLACFEKTEAARFLKKLEVHSVNAMVKESTFSKGNFCIYEGFLDVFYIFTSA